ncbi:hypothetical protein HC256_007436 [Beauveria bassiana]|nr:hypothetical protein HC256_007436 [Beauveria bassiana]
MRRNLLILSVALDIDHLWPSFQNRLLARPDSQSFSFSASTAAHRAVFGISARLPDPASSGLPIGLALIAERNPGEQVIERPNSVLEAQNIKVYNERVLYSNIFSVLANI